MVRVIILLKQSVLTLVSGAVQTAACGFMWVTVLNEIALGDIQILNVINHRVSKKLLPPQAPLWRALVLQWYGAEFKLCH